MISRRYSLSTIIGLANGFVIIFIGSTLLGYWFWLAAPLIQSDERTKTELLAASYTKIVTEALHSGELGALEAILGELLLLTEPDGKSPMILRIEIDRQDGSQVAQGSAVAGSGLPTFVVEAPLFSPTTFELLGTMRLYKSLVPDAQQTVFWATATAIIVFLLGFQGMLWRLMRPLKRLATNVEGIDATSLRALPNLRGYASQEIQQVGDAVRGLLARLDEAQALTERQREFAERQAVELARSNAELEQFAYVASHDLKAPLRAIDNLSSWLEQDLDSMLEGDNREHMQLLRGRVGRLERLLDDLLAYSRVGRAQVDIESVDCGALVKEISNLLEVPPTFTMSVAEDMPVLETARGPLEQVFRNLVGNAIKHHDRADGHIDVSVTDRGEFYEFRVADDGPGISPEFHDRAFQMFQTLRPRDEVEGSGMGLAIVRKLIESQGGRIRVESENENRGAAFCFAWPKRWSRRKK